MSYETANIEYKGFRIRIIHDENAEKPDEWEDTEQPFSFLVGFDQSLFRHTREGFREPEDVDDWRERYDIYGLEAYAHSAVRLGLVEDNGTHDFDRGQIGYVLVKKHSALEQLGEVHTWPDRPEQRKLAQGLLRVWNQYLSGDVWGYRIEDSDGEELESSWGFYGSEDCMEEAKSIADSSMYVRTVKLVVLTGPPNKWSIVSVDVPARVGQGKIPTWAVTEGPLKGRGDLVMAVLYDPIKHPLQQTPLQGEETCQTAQ